MRHVLLLAVLLDGQLMAKERMETLLELHSNALVREATALYVGERPCSAPAAPASLMMPALASSCAGQQSKALEALIQQLSGGTPAAVGSVAAIYAGLKPAQTVSSTGSTPIQRQQQLESTQGYDGHAVLKSLLDISLLRFQDRDR
jgi:hypothetical protein